MYPANPIGMWLASNRLRFVRVPVDREAAAGYRSPRAALPPSQARRRPSLVWKGCTRAPFLVSELADYELRRELLRLGATRSLSRLDELTRELPYIPVTTATWRRAAELWAVARNAGNVLVAAQALEENAVVLTNNTRHFESLSGRAVDLAALG